MGICQVSVPVIPRASEGYCDRCDVVLKVLTFPPSTHVWHDASPLAITSLWALRPRAPNTRKFTIKSVADREEHLLSSPYHL